MKTGSYAPNALGLYDMSGNVREWCWDLYKNTSDFKDKRIVKGGAWVDPANKCRVSFKGYNKIAGAYHIGFRCVRNAN